jgi:hypothetical protein
LPKREKRPGNRKQKHKRPKILTIEKVVTLDEEQYAEIMEYAKTHRCPFTQAVRELIEFGLESLA